MYIFDSPTNRRATLTGFTRPNSIVISTKYALIRFVTDEDPRDGNGFELTLSVRLATSTIGSTVMTVGTPLPQSRTSTSTASQTASSPSFIASSNTSL